MLACLIKNILEFGITKFLYHQFCLLYIYFLCEFDLNENVLTVL